MSIIAAGLPTTRLRHGGSNSANTAGNGSDGTHNGLYLFVHRITRHTALALGGDLFGIPVHGNIDDDLALADKFLGQAAQHAGGRNDDISLPADGSGIHSLGVAHGNGGILAHEHHSGRLANHQAPANNHSGLALAVDAVVIQNLHTGGGGAGGIAQILALKHTGVGHMGHRVHILAGGQPVADLVLVVLQMLGQRPEHQNAVNRIVRIHFVDHLQHILFGCILGQDVVLNSHAHFLGPLGRALFIAQIRGVFAQADDAQGGGDTLFL